MSNERPIHFMLTTLSPIKYTINLLYFSLTRRRQVYRSNTVTRLHFLPPTAILPVYLQLATYSRFILAPHYVLFCFKSFQKNILNVMQFLQIFSLTVCLLAKLKHISLFFLQHLYLSRIFNN